jgi:hypothetical protein
MAARRLKNGMVLTGDNEQALDQAVAELEKQAAIHADRERLWGKDMRIAMSRLCGNRPGSAGCAA